MEYSKITSDYIRSRIAQTSWADREYIDDLVRLARSVTQKPTGALQAWGRDVLERKYPGEWLELCREHSEEKYQQELALRKEVREAEAKRKAEREAEREAEEIQSREDWEKAGGRP